MIKTIFSDVARASASRRNADETNSADGTISTGVKVSSTVSTTLIFPLISACALTSIKRISSDFDGVVVTISKSAVTSAVGVVGVVGKASATVGVGGVDAIGADVAAITAPLVDAGAVAAAVGVASNNGGVIGAVGAASALQVAVGIVFVSFITESTVLRFVDVGRALITARTVPRISAGALTFITILFSLSHSSDSESVSTAVESRSTFTVASWIV